MLSVWSYGVTALAPIYSPEWMELAVVQSESTNKPRSDGVQNRPHTVEIYPRLRHLPMGAHLVPGTHGCSEGGAAIKAGVRAGISRRV